MLILAIHGDLALRFKPIDPRLDLNHRFTLTMKKLILTTALILSCTASFGPSSAYSQSSSPTTEPVLAAHPLTPETPPEEGWWTSLPKEKKLLYTNVTAASLIGIWGLIEWDYGSADWIDADEGWFEKDSKYGGADKLGHFWATYAFADALTGLYKGWGYSSDRANFYGAISAWSVQAFMEVADGTSGSQGFAWEDMVANTVGALTSVLMENYPELDRKIDFRVEYVFENDVNGIFDDYSNHYYSMALKLDGFDTLQDTFLKYFELHAGYYTRGYDDPDEEDSRSFYGGITVNFSSLLQQNGWEKTGKTLEYLQIPYSVLKVSHDLN